MKPFLCLTLGLWLALVLPIKVSGFEMNAMMEGSYIEQTNGTYAVCAYDLSQLKLFQFKGVVLTKEQLPHVGPMGPGMIFALGDMPEPVVDESNPWKPRTENTYSYGPIPYPIVEVDPPLVFCTTDLGDIVLGIKVRGIFIAFDNLGKKEQNRGDAFPRINAESVVYVSPPKHRRAEISDLIATIINNKTSE